MTLAQYKKKRNFSKTPEPTGATKDFKGPLTFVIQKHEASHLHYDFRLEMDGVLKSWAVPKGPSLNPEDRRLAMLVEDHPLDYAGFEGIIPKGQYGGGTVMVWDKGVYSPYEAVERKDAEKILLEQLKKGHLTIIMLGEKLKGEFALIKTHGSEENAWLLIKKGDEYASKKDILKEDHSVLTKRTMEQITSQSLKKKDVWNSLPRDLDLSDTPSEKIPHDVKPMLAETVDEPFDKTDWIFEIKLDGYRTLAEIDSKKVELYSRNNQSFDEKFKEVLESLKNFPGNAVLDGEVVVLNKDGLPVFEWLQDYPKSKKGELVYYVFDILHLNGHNLRRLPLIKRKEILKKVLPDLPHVRFSDHIEKNGVNFFKQAQNLKLEGVIAKDAKSIYKENSRSFHWLKIKTGLRQDAIICGFTKGRGLRSYFGALVLGIREHGKLRYIGHTGGGFDEDLLESTFKKLAPLKQEECPFDEKPQTNAPVTWVKPILECEVKFNQWTEKGQMRQPIFLSLKDDTPSESLTTTEEISINRHSLKLTNLNKIFWPKEKYTKGDLINYYREIAPFILPHLINRPQSLLRYPDGIGGMKFFQKDAGNLKAEWVMRAQVKHGKEKIEYLLCQNEASLVYLINLGCIDLNPWSSRIHKLDYPDYLVIDLDPKEASFQTVIEVALACRKVLEKLNIESFPKTSGASGMHIYIPMGAKYDYETVKNFAHLLCIEINKLVPEITTLERVVKKRHNKVYLDFLQNNRGQTLASVYSVRARPEATVSTPLKWEEVTKSLKVTDFTIKNLPTRLQKHGDLFKGVLGKAVNIKQILKKLEI